MSNRSSCRVLRTLGMDGFLGFKCGPSCSEKQHNKEIKALIDAIDDLLAYDSKTKKELGADVPKGGLGDDAMSYVVTDKLDDIKDMVGSLLGKHIPEPFWSSALQPWSLACDENLRSVSATVDSIRRRIPLDDDPRIQRLSGKERFALTSHVRQLWSTHGIIALRLEDGATLK